MGKEDAYYIALVKAYRKKLSQDQIDFNIEMIAIEDEDHIRLFQEGLIAKNELIELLTGKKD